MDERPDRLILWTDVRFRWTTNPEVKRESRIHCLWGRGALLPYALHHPIQVALRTVTGTVPVLVRRASTAICSKATGAPMYGRTESQESDLMESDDSSPNDRSGW